MNPPKYPLSRRANGGGIALFLGGAAVLLAATGCGRRPIIVQAPPATVIQASPPVAAAPATVIQTPAAPAPTGRDVIVVKEAP